MQYMAEEPVPSRAATGGCWSGVSGAEPRGSALKHPALHIPLSPTAILSHICIFQGIKREKLLLS